MKKKDIITSLLVMMVCIGLSGCTTDDKNNLDPSSSDSERFVGTWSTSEPIQWHIKPSFTFYSNQTFYVQNLGGTYTAENNTLALHWDTEDNVVYEYTYTFLDEDTVELTSISTGDKGLYTRE